MATRPLGSFSRAVFAGANPAPFCVLRVTRTSGLWHAVHRNATLRGEGIHALRLAWEEKQERLSLKKGVMRVTLRDLSDIF